MSVMVSCISRRALALAVLGVCACSAESDDSGGGRTPTTPGAGQFGNADPGAPATPGDFGNTGAGGAGDPVSTVLNPDEGCVTGGSGAQGAFEFSYIWVANAGESTISKIDTRTLTELGRYLTRADANGNPSRTSVSLSGDVAVANRNGGVAKFYARESSCVDANGDGTIQTSTGKDDVLPWDQEECRAWYTDFQYNSQRPIAWTAGQFNPATCAYENEMVWTSGTAFPCGDLDCQVDVIRLNGDTGTVESMKTIVGLMGSNFISGGLGGLDFGFGGLGIAGYGAYGGASDGDGNFWLFISNTTQLIRVDFATFEHEIWKIPGNNAYGITVDEMGRVFTCGQTGVTRFDYATQQFENNPAVVSGFNGCMADGAGTLWVGSGGDGGVPAVQSVNTDTLALDRMIMVPAGVKGVSIDFDGYVWGIAKGNTASRIDPMSGEVQTYDGLNDAYSYSDMTGFGLRAAGTAMRPD